jgi:hypothetical protein
MSKGIGFGIIDLAVIFLILIGVVYFFSQVGNIAGYSLKSITENTALKPITPIIDMAEQQANRDITLPLGLLALIIVAVAFLTKL